MVNKKYLESNGVYHIIQRASGNELLFKNMNDRRQFILLMQKYFFEYKISLLAFSLLPNHIHLQVQIKEINLSKCLKAFFHSYARFFNSKYGRKGHVFYGVYRAVHCPNTFSQLIVSTYIHLNSFKAKISNSPFNYKWHSLNEYTEYNESGLTDSEKILKILNNDISSAKLIYKNLIKNLSEFSYEHVINNPKALQLFYNVCEKNIKFADLI